MKVGCNSANAARILIKIRQIFASFIHWIPELVLLSLNDTVLVSRKEAMRI